MEYVRGGFERLWLAQTVSLMGDYLAMYAIQAAVVFQMHGTARQMTGVLIASLIPTAVLGPIAGVFADRWNARRTMIASDVIRAMMLATLAFASTLWQIYAVSSVVSCVSAFFAPAFSITVPRQVESKALLKANAKLQQSMNAVRIASPAVAGALIAVVGTRACYWADAASYLVSAVLIATLPKSCGLQLARHVGPVSLRAIYRNLMDGIRYINTAVDLRLAMLSMAFGVFATGCFTALVSIYVRDVLGRSAAAYGLLGALIAAGTLTGSLLLANFARMRDPKAWIGAGLFAVGLFIVQLAVVANYFAAQAAFLGIGVGAAVTMTASATLLQGTTPDGMRGRVSSASASLMSVAQGAAILTAGNAAAWIGVRPVYALSGLLLLSLPVSRYCRR